MIVEKETKKQRNKETKKKEEGGTQSAKKVQRKCKEQVQSTEKMITGNSYNSGGTGGIPHSNGLGSLRYCEERRR